MEVVTMFTRARCGLCEDMKAELERRGYQVKEVDIDQDEALVRKYGHDVPVVIREDGSELARHRLPPYVS